MQHPGSRVHCLPSREVQLCEGEALLILLLGSLYLQIFLEKSISCIALHYTALDPFNRLQLPAVQCQQFNASNAPELRPQKTWLNMVLSSL